MEGHKEKRLLETGSDTTDNAGIFHQQANPMKEEVTRLVRLI